MLSSPIRVMPQAGGDVGQGVPGKWGSNQWEPPTGWHCIAQHFQNAVQCSANLPGRLTLRLAGGLFSYLSWVRCI
jgi:hypothetical protein